MRLNEQCENVFFWNEPHVKKLHNSCQDLILIRLANVRDLLSLTLDILSPLRSLLRSLSLSGLLSRGQSQVRVAHMTLAVASSLTAGVSDSSAIMRGSCIAAHTVHNVRKLTLRLYPST